MQERCVWNKIFLLGPISLKHDVPMYTRLGQKLVMVSIINGITIEFIYQPLYSTPGLSFQRCPLLICTVRDNKHLPANVSNAPNRTSVV